MSIVVKFIVGVFVIMCCVQFIEMSRIRREEDKSPIADLTAVVNSLVEKLKGAIDEDTVKKLMDAAGKAISDGSKVVNEQLSDITSKISAGGAGGGAGGH